MHTSVSSVYLESSSSEQETKMQDHPSLQPSTGQAQFVPDMFMPYRGHKMDWTVNDGLYHRFLKWKLKYEKILIVNLHCFLSQRNARKS